MSKNPFIADPLKDKTQALIGRDKELNDAIYYSDSASMFFVIGNQGVGKTFLARKLIEHQKKEYTVQYIDAKQFSKNKDIQVVLKTKKTILIVDNVEHLTVRNIERIKYYFDQNYVSSVMFIGTEFKLNGSLKNRIGKRIIFLNPVNEPYKIYSSRTESTLSRAEVERIYENSENIKDFIKELSVIYSNSPELTFMQEEGRSKSGNCHKCDSQLINLNDEWRCRKCDIYCTLCGELVSKEDEGCPRCLAVFE